VDFKKLRQLATDPKFTYDNFVNTDDVAQLFNKQPGMNLKPLFNFIYAPPTNLKSKSGKQDFMNTR